MEFASDLFRKIPKSFLRILGFTGALGLITYGSLLTNFMPAHDSIYLWQRQQTLSALVSNQKWLQYFATLGLGNVANPWLSGVVALILIAISAWMVCDCLRIRQTAPQLCVAALMLINPTMISSFLYMGGVHAFALALFFASCAVWVFARYKKGWIGAFFLLLAGNFTYAAYFSFAAGLFLLVALLWIFEDETKGSFLLKRQLFMLVDLVPSLFLAYWIPMKTSALSGEQQTDRLASASAMELTANDSNVGLVYGIKRALYQVWQTYGPTGELSYFQKQPVIFAAFWLMILVLVVLFVCLLCRTKEWKRDPLKVILMVADICLLPLAINFIGIFYTAHGLMMYAFVLPLLAGIEIYEIFGRLQPETREKKPVFAAGVSMILLLCTLILSFGGIRLANVAATKEYAISQSAVELVSRITDRIESTEGYIPGETPVMIIGDTRAYYANYQEGFALCDSLTGVGSNWWDTAITQDEGLGSYIHQILGVDMNLIFVKTDAGYTLSNLSATVEKLAKAGYDLDGEDFLAAYEAAPIYPDSESVFWQKDVLVVKLGELE